MQKPLLHSPACWQDWPIGFRPQLPLRQTLPVRQSASEVQWLTQAAAPALHLKGAQVWTPGARQVPRPLQVPAVISRSPAQTGETQMVSGA